MKKQETIDLVIMLIFPVIASVFTFILNANILNANFLWSIILFFIVPNIYLSLRSPQNIKKTLIFALVLGFFAILPIDYISNVTMQKYIISSAFSVRLFGRVAIESLLWAVASIYYIVMFYEYFLDKHVTRKLKTPHFKYLLIIILIIISLFISLLFINPDSLNISYFYLYFGSAMLFVPLLFELIKRKALASKFFMAGAYFFYMSFIYEISALKLGWWDFPSSLFVGWITIFNVGFPIEELVFFGLLFSMAVLAWYEYFDDDEK